MFAPCRAVCLAPLAYRPSPHSLQAALPSGVTPFCTGRAWRISYSPCGHAAAPWGPLPNLPEPQRPNWPQHLANLAVQASRHRVAPFAGPSLSKAQDGPLPKGPDQPLSSRTLQYAQTPLPKPFCEPRDLKKHTLQVTFFVRRMEDPRPLSGQTRHLPRLDRCLKSWQECCQHMQSWLLRTALFPVPDTCSKDLNVSNPQKENPLEDRLHTH